jgi:hypothetical protein
MVDPINVKVCTLFHKRYSSSRCFRKLKFGGLIEGELIPKGKIGNLRNFAPGGPKWGM